MLLEEATQARIDEKLKALERDRNRKTRDKPIYVRAHIAFVQAYYRKRARRTPSLKLVRGGAST